MQIITEYRKVFILTVFDENGRIVDTRRYTDYGTARHYQEKFIKECAYHSVTLITREIPHRGFTIQAIPW
jgi:hypothetical protein